MDIRKYIKENILILDGGMGTMLQQRSLKPGELPEALNIKDPAVVKSVHADYFNAGSKMVLANTFGANGHKLAKRGYKTHEIVMAAVRNAREAANGCGGLVALDIGPIGELLEPYGDLEYDDAEALFAEQVLAGIEAGVDAIVIETMTDLNEIKCAADVVRKNTELPLFCTMSFESNMRTFMGVDIPSMAEALEGAGADAIGMNCSVGPSELLGMVSELMKHTKLPIIAKPNAGLPELVDGNVVYNVSADEFAAHMGKLLDMGVRVIGGCCGTTPEFIKKLAENVCRL